MPERGTGRSLVEAYVHLDLMVSGASDRATVTDTPEGWVLRVEDVEVLVPYEAEETAQQAGAVFGTGLSELLDPGQWVLIAGTYASRALEEGLFYAAGPEDPEQFDAIAADWSFAAEAVAEALKFLPEGATELPVEEFWSEMGREARDAEPGQFTREKLEGDLAFFRQSLDDFHRLHAH
ncbi:hypothetical protein SAMN05444920_101964 [Nonomuraea solani]|uniref:Uncharacterized protein n=1 Tax=Nonomuraea solani TaxID=1144553 RepID=A0A1H5VTM7_9ACTN|nr:hypothetical protein [Nonomuraea solani]SEF89897.1 hypothetical protein SAMN05444920_101964 [Nonomuraea solani]